MQLLRIYFICLGAVLLVSLISRIVMLVLVSQIAREKGYSSGKYVVITLFFGFVGLFAVVALPDKKSQMLLMQISGRLSSLESETPKKEARTCKNCGSEAPLDAAFCISCGKSLE